MERSIEDYNSVLNFNKEIISSLLDLKKCITFALQKCEKKLTLIERSLQKHTIGDTKVLICNAGIPYFKDRNYFFAPNNKDEVSKENQKELQVRNLPKVSTWTIKERNIFLKAIKEEIIADASYSQKLDCTADDGSRINTKLKNENEKKMDEMLSASDFLEMVGPLEGGKEFNWFKISSIHFDDVHSPLDCRVMWNVFLHPSINKNVWTKSEDVKLKEIVKRHKYQNWEQIGKDLNTNRTAYQCFIRYNTTKILAKVRNYGWKAEEDERLLKLVEIFQIGDFIPWGEVANWIKNRTKQQAYFRWAYSLAPYLIKGRFTKTEDRLLKDAVTKYGTNFRKISAALMPNRSTVQLHDRYQTLTKKQSENWKVWTFAEDSKLLELFERFGPNWSRISKAFSRKSRTQLRHRHAALQRYIKRGISLIQLHRNQDLGVNERNEKRSRREEISCRDSSRRTISPSNQHDADDEIDTELIRYFYTEEKRRFFVRKDKLYTSAELSRDTKTLYGILQRLNANLCIPDNIQDIKLTERDQQLVRSFKEYAKLNNDKQRCFKAINEYSLRMFGTDYNNKEGSHFIPPLPFDSQMKRSVETESNIDYKLNTNNKFLLEKPTEIDTADFVISHIGGYEQQLQFQKFTRSLQITSESCHFRPCFRRPTKMVSQLTTESADSSDNPATSFEKNNVDACRGVKLQKKKLCNATEETGSSCDPETEITNEKDVPVIEASHATISSYRNLTHLRRLNENYIQSSRCFVQEESCNFQNAVKLLETRLEQLFRYPMGLSKTAVPKVYAIDTIDDIDKSKRKSYKLSDKHKGKKLQMFDVNSKYVS